MCRVIGTKLCGSYNIGVWNFSGFHSETFHANRAWEGNKTYSRNKINKRNNGKNCVSKHRYLEPATLFWVGVYVRRQSSCLVTFDLLFI